MKHIFAIDCSHLVQHKVVANSYRQPTSLSLYVGNVTGLRMPRAIGQAARRENLSQLDLCLAQIPGCEEMAQVLSCSSVWKGILYVGCNRI